MSRFLTVGAAQMGPISTLRVVVDRETGKRKGFAFLEFFDQDTAQRAVHELDDHGAPLHVDCGAGGGQIAAVTFAAYGTPTGSCQDPSGLALDASCNAPDALPAARAACCA